MRVSRRQKIIIGLVVLGIALMGIVLIDNSTRKSKENNRDILEAILRNPDNAPFGNIARNTPFYDGGPVSTIEASYDNRDVAQVQADLQQRLAAEKFTLTCPGGTDSSVTTLQENTTEPRQKCGIRGHGADGTVWIGTSVTGTQVSAIIRF